MEDLELCNTKEEVLAACYEQIMDKSGMCEVYIVSNVTKDNDMKRVMDQIIAERKKKHMEDDYGIQDCWDQMTDVLAEDVHETIAYLDNCSEEDVYFIREIFEDVSDKLQSKEYIDCLRRLDEKFSNLNMKRDIDLAEAFLK